MFDVVEDGVTWRGQETSIVKMVLAAIFLIFIIFLCLWWSWCQRKGQQCFQNSCQRGGGSRSQECGRGERMRGDRFGVTHEEAITVRDGLNTGFWWKGQAEDKTRTQARDIDHMLLLPWWGKSRDAKGHTTLLKTFAPGKWKRKLKLSGMHPKLLKRYIFKNITKPQSFSF